VNGPTNDNQQEQNIKTILQNIGADVFGLVEVVDESRLANVVSQMPGYTYIVGQYGSHVNPPDPNGGSLSEAQKLAFVYKTSVLSNVVTRPLINNQDVSSTSYNNWSSGRYPFLMTADVTLHGVTKRINFVLIHAKANTSPTNISYQRRLASANELHDTLQTYFANDNVIVLGDFNDDLDQSITAGFTTTSYTAFTTDNAHFFSPTLALSLAHKKSTVSYNEMIDHVMLSNELQPYYMPATANVLTDVTALVSNYGSTTTDHYPVFTRYMYCELVCPSNITVNTDPGTCGAVVNFTVGTTMNCGTVTATPASGSLFSAGTTTVTVVASSGETCSFTVTVNDQELPLITAPSNISVTADAGQCSAQISSLGTPETSDNCGVQSVTNDAPAGNQFTVGTHTLTWMVTDIHGNTTTAAQTITVTDTEAPLITAPAAITVSAQAGICAATISNLGNPATSDNCGIASTINDAPQNGVYAVGSHTITWTVTDVHGLTATATQTVTVTDNELPVIQTCPVVPVQCYNASGTYTVPEIEAHDNCGTVSYSFVVTGATSRSGTGTNASGTFAVGTSTITWTVRDDAGNTATCQTTVRINSPVSSSIPDVFAVSPGGAANTIYNGYGPASVTLTANVTGGTTPYAYKWTIGSSAGPALNSTASYTVSPVTTTTYFLNVKDVYGCSAPLVTRTINVVDVRCGPKQDKVVICQIVKGKPTTSCVLSKDVSSYLADGATLGTCPNANATQPMAGTPAQLRLTAMGMPNPSAHFFTIMLYGGITDEAVNVRVTDAVGRVTEQKNNLSSSRQFTLGMDYKPGMYFVEISQGTERIVLKLLKVK
jgi:endonuclease/exonuclease/phosphatase family metal-dependent hydrolase